MKTLKQWIPSMLIAVIITLCFRTYVAEAMKVPTGSMIPTIEINDHLFVEKLMWLTDIDYGDLVVFHPPVERDEKEKYVKRVVGLPGDIIEVKDQSLYRNHQKIDEPYLNEVMTYTYGPVEVPEGHYFVLGDNRNISNDSHLWPSPFLAKDRIIGKVLTIVPTHVFWK
ncbi:signal peptidase I [Paenibacillus sp. 1001270B_150601_E10]|uniref:signal peptidase I n=1 Tax=Paenibacillus sp. 1001270B_150601_E10 TaxID=2787079 RepID=UPI00189EA361|nr:signal peptidase I [Paenibacillus sp. 1001270B_150601_E10]